MNMEGEKREPVLNRLPLGGAGTFQVSALEELVAEPISIDDFGFHRR
jgi:hypothetical protein